MPASSPASPGVHSVLRVGPAIAHFPLFGFPSAVPGVVRSPAIRADGHVPSGRRWKRTGPGGPPGLQNRSLPALRGGWVRLPGASAITCSRHCTSRSAIGRLLTVSKLEIRMTAAATKIGVIMGTPANSLGRTEGTHWRHRETMNFCEHSESQRLDLASILRPLCRVRADWSVLLCCVCLLLGGVANATNQQFTGGVRGLVRDAEGVSAGATVRLTNENTNGERRAVTNDAGQYAFVAVPPGTYTVRTSLPDHRTVVRPGIEIGTQEFITLDLLLEVGAPEDPLTVIPDVPSIETANASVASVLDRLMLGTLAVAQSQSVRPGRHGPNGRLRRRATPHAAGRPDRLLPHLDRGRRYPSQQLRPRRRADQRPAWPLTAESDDRGDTGRQDSSAYVRRRGGPHGRRRVQHDCACGHQRLPWLRVLSDPTGVGTVA